MTEPTRPTVPEVHTRENRDVQSMLELREENLDPSFAYRWVSTNPVTMARRRMQGYRPVTIEEATNLLIVQVDDQTEGIVKIGDTILMKCPRKYRDDRMRANEAKRTQRMTVPKKRVEKMARDGNVKTITED